MLGSERPVSGPVGLNSLVDISERRCSLLLLGHGLELDVRDDARWRRGSAIEVRKRVIQEKNVSCVRFEMKIRST